tara:strand:- start:984 stop:1190 length:207 start_codon:yes stop_codon:yes gene_type:complete
MTNFDDSTAQMTEAEIKSELKALKKKVKQMEAQRERIREWAHKAELLDAKKMKLRYKQMLEELDKDET